ncbi:MAG: DNA polymerase III subunit delta [Minwuia sp.]|uniref:DNA polymerase III subunit delta n=1 Tax=Minwuia sp. TaxID=2493630 RepID=UPI003A850322
MEPKPWEVDAYLRKPDPGHRVFVIHGPDTGLVKERADRLAAHHLGRDFDPFQLVRLTPEMLAEDPARLMDETTQIGMFGGERVIRVTDAGHAAVGRAAAALLDDAEPAAVVIFEAADMKPANPIRKWAAKSDRAAVLACFADNEQDLDRLAGDALREAGLQADRDARSMIVERMGPDRQANRRMLETLVTYKLGTDGQVTADDVESVLGDQSAVGYDAIAFAAFDGNTSDALALYDKSVAENTDPNAIVASLLRHLDRFDVAEENFAATGLRQKKMQAAFRAQMGRWPAARLSAARRLTVEAQIDMRGQHYQIADLVCRHLILRLSAAAGRR